MSLRKEIRRISEILYSRISTAEFALSTYRICLRSKFGASASFFPSPKSNNKAVACPTHRLHVGRMRGVVFHLPPDAVDVDHDRIFVDHVVAPDERVEFRFGKHAPRVVEKEFYQRVFLGGKRDLLPVFIKTQCAGIVTERPRRPYRRGRE